MSKKLKKELEDELEACEYKIRCEMDPIRKELKSLKNKSCNYWKD